MTEDVLTQAKAMLPELQALRRQLHQIPEFGLDLPKTLELILKQIKTDVKKLLEKIFTHYLRAFIKEITH
jgi:metal-dependent amidase/aminoacylase/carboxypeptidase family protein